ncbi:MAG TPA: sigma factor G inhibitor Gin [Syntrophomonadaceae bacterium]|nr:sigma factor G inhibitor Gin [Syntrophomonadaceae bacterium]HNX28892.1 sigma factor G inhibitor Gin [Syntrophomonadaceae bacterium]HPR93241.1 sigma factor G inhibitor Gin [Syntrophomonadaceae bacterium]
MALKRANDNSGSDIKLLPICSICQRVPKNGIRGGIRIKKGFICHYCEEEMASLRVESPLYEEIKEKIKAIIK